MNGVLVTPRSRASWTLDWYAIPYSMPCNNCADLTVASFRVIRGGYFDFNASSLRSAYRNGNYPWFVGSGLFLGARCARTSL